MTTPTGGGTDIVALGISVDATQPQMAAEALDKMGTATIKAVDSLDKLSDSASANSKWIAEANSKYKNKIQLLEEQFKAQQNAIKAEQDAAKAVQMGVDENTRFITSLRERIATFGMSKTELLAHTAAQLNATQAAAPLIAQLDRLTAEYGKQGVAIKTVTDLEKERIEFETKALTVFNAFKTRTLNENAANEEAAMTALNAQRVRMNNENLANERSALTTLNAQRIRAINDQAKAEESAMASLNAQRVRSINDQAKSEESARTALNAQRIRSINDAAKEAINAAEKQAIEEIDWNRKSVKARIDELKRLQEFQKASVRPETIEQNFSPTAIKNLPNLGQYIKELEESEKGHKRVSHSGKEVGSVFDGISFSSARARAEIIVLAHEMVSGNFRRIPGSMMVLAEYTGMARLATSALGLAFAGVAVAAGVMAYEFVNGLIQVKNLNDALNRSNAVSGATASSLTSMAEAAGKVNGEFGAAYEASAALARGGKFTAEQLGLIIPVVTNLEHYFSGSLATSVKEFETLVAKASRTGINSTFEVTRAIVDLNDQYHFLSSAQLQMIVDLESEGKQREASAMAIRLFAEEGEKAATRAKEYMGNIEAGWHAIKAAIETAGQAMANWGKVNTKQQDLQLLIENYKKFLQDGQELRSHTRESKAYQNMKKSFDERIALATAALAEESRLAKLASDKQREQDEANHYIAMRRVEDRTLMVKSGTELQNALERNAEAVDKIVSANPSYFDDPARVDYEAQRIGAIYRKYAEKEKADKKNHARDEFNERFREADAHFKLVQDQIARNEKLTEQAIRAGVVTEDAGYKTLRDNREKELKALEDWHRKRQAIIAGNPNAKGADKARKDTDIRYTDKRADIEGGIAQNEADRLAREAMAWTKVMDATENAYKSEQDGLDKAIEKQSQHNAEIGKTREQIELARAAKDAAYTAAAAQEAESIKWALAEAELTGSMTPQMKEFYTAKMMHLEQVAAKQRELVELHKVGAELEASSPNAISKDFDRQSKEWKSLGDTISKTLTEAFGKGGKAAGQMFEAFADGQARQIILTKNLVKAKAEAKGTDDEHFRIRAAQNEYDRETTFTRINEYGQMTQAAAGFFDEQSTGYKALQAASQVFHAAELAMTLAELVPKAISAVLNQGNGDPYTAFGRMAAMGALVAGLGVAISGSGSKGPSSKQRQDSAGTGSVFGSANIYNSKGEIDKYGDKSESIARSLEIMEKGSGLSLVYSSKMVESLRSIDSQIGGLAGLVSGKFGADPAMGIKGIETGTSNLLGSGATNLLGFSAKSGAVGGMIIAGPIGALVGAVAGYIAGKITNVKQTIVDSGIALDKSTLEQINSGGVNGSTYADVNTRKKFLGIKYSDKTKQVTGELDTELEDQFTKIVQQMATSISLGADMIGIGGDEFTKKLNSFVVDIGSISFKDLSGEEIEKQLQSIFSKVGDDMAKFALSDLQQFQKIGEGYLETLVRVANNFKSVEVIFKSFGKTSELSLGVTERLVEMSGGLDAFSRAAEEFLQTFYDNKERATMYQAQIEPEFQKYGLTTQGPDAGKLFRDFIIGLDVTTESGAAAYASLMRMQPGFKVILDFAEELESERKALQEKIANERKSLQDELDDLTMTSVQLLGKQRNALDESNRSLFDQIEAIKAQKIAIESVKTKAASLITSAETAFSVLQRSVSAEKTKLSELHSTAMDGLKERIDAENKALAISKARSNLLTNAKEQLHVEGLGSGARADAQAQIKTMLVIARASGILPTADALNSPLSVLTKDASDQFATVTEMQRDFYKTQNDIAALSKLSDDALSIEERTLLVLEEQKRSAQSAYEAEVKRLDALVDHGQQQIDALKGIDAATLSVVDAVKGLATALAAAQKNSYNSSTASITSTYQSAIGRDPDAEGLKWWQDQVAKGTPIADIIGSITNSPEAKIRAMYTELLNRPADDGGLDFFMRSGASYEEIRKQIMQSDEYKNKLPGLAVGTNYVSEDTAVVVHKGERVMPAADNLELMERLRSPAQTNVALSAAVERLSASNDRLTKEVEGLRVEARATATHTEKIARTLDRVVVDDALVTREEA